MGYWTIYCHIHIESGRRYIGLTKRTILQRWNDHVYVAMRKSKGGRWHFPNAIRKYGKDAFTHEILEVCDELELANAAEIKWINHFNTRDPQFGFNLTKGGEHTPHPIRKNPWDNPEYRAKNLQRIIAAGQTPEARIKSKAALNTPESRAKRSAATIRQFSDPAARAVLSETVKALHKIPEIAEKFRSGFRKTNAERAAKTHCKHGHEFTLENTYIYKNGRRKCRKCGSNEISQKMYDARTHCKNGHELIPGNFRYVEGSRKRICLLCVVTHCKRGHEFTLENTYLNNNGSKVCKICERIRGRQSDARRRAKRKLFNHS